VARYQRNSRGVTVMSIHEIIEVNKPNLGDRIRGIADQLKQETHVQIKATSRILGAAAQISENHDRLIDEVSDMVQDDLARAAELEEIDSITIEQLKQKFKNLAQAKQYFNLKASSWAALTDKLNERTAVPQIIPAQSSISSRLDSIEVELKELRANLSQVTNVLKVILEKVS
jgi:hypothetical protein